MTQLGSGESGSVARVFVQQSERLGRAWRRMRFAQAQTASGQHNALDDVVEAFIASIGYRIAGVPGSPWARTRGVFRVSRRRGSAGMSAEFKTLRRCLLDAIHTVGGTKEDIAIVNQSIAEAYESAVEMFAGDRSSAPRAPSIPFGGWVIELYGQDEPSQRDSAAAAHLGDERNISVH